MYKKKKKDHEAPEASRTLNYLPKKKTKREISRQNINKSNKKDKNIK